MNVDLEEEYIKYFSNHYMAAYAMIATLIKIGI